jgi:hypothetical protein
LTGDWGKILLSSSGSVFNCAHFYYGGKSDSTLEINGIMVNSATITNSTFAHNNGGSVADNLKPVGALRAENAAATTVITGNIFYDNKVPLSISGQFNVDDSNVFHNPAAAGVKNTYNGIFLTGNSYKAITGLITFSETEVPFVIGGDIDVPLGSALTIGDNVVIKFFVGNYTLRAEGTIVANATAGNKIVFTSLKDDSHGGDTNGDGAISSPAVGDWRGVTLNANGSTFNRCEFYYGGQSTADRGTLSLTTFSATVTNSIFAHNHGGDISSPGSSEYGALNASKAAAGTIITGNTFYANSIPMEMSGNFSIDDSNVFHDPANPSVTNTYNGIFFTGNSANYISTITLAETEVAFAIKGDIWVQTGKTLTIGDNVAFKFYDAPTKISFQGSVVNQTGTGVKFTSLKDDTVKGDTNGDGTASTPAIGDWYGIRDNALNYTHPANIFYNLY